MKKARLVGTKQCKRNERDEDNDNQQPQGGMERKIATVLWKKKFKGNMAWKNVPPNDGEAETKVVKGKKYYWCKHHEYWCFHPSHECTFKDNNNSTSEDQGITSSMAGVGLEDIIKGEDEG